MDAFERLTWELGFAEVSPTSGTTEAYGHNARIFDLSFCPTNSDLIVSASDDCSAKVWEADGDKFRQSASFHGHSDSVMCVNWDLNGRLIASGSADTTVQLWNPAFDEAGESTSATYGVQSTGTLEGHPEEVYAVEFVEGSAGRQMLTASAWKPFLWDLETCQMLAECDSIQAPADDSTGSMPERWQAAHIFAARQMPQGGPLVAAACSDGAVRFWSIHSSGRALEPRSVARVHSKGMGSACAWDPNGFQLASLATDGTAAVLDIRMGGQICWAVDFGRPMYSCEYIPGLSHVLAACGKGSSLSVVSTGDCSHTEPHQRQEVPESRDMPGVIHSGKIRWKPVTECPSGQGEKISPQLSDSLEAPIQNLNLSDGRSKGPESFQSCCSVPSCSKTMGQRNLLCLASSRDGLQLAASDQLA